MNQPMPKAINPRVYLSLALGIVLIYFAYFYYFYTPWNWAGGLYMPEFGLSFLTYFATIPLIIALMIAIAFPKETSILTAIILLSIYVFSTFIISWPLIFPIHLIINVYSRLENRQPKPKRSLKKAITITIIILCLISFGLELQKSLSMTEQINRLGTDLLHQFWSLFIMTQTSVIIMTSTLLLVFRNKITLGLMIFFYFMYSLYNGLMWLITLPLVLVLILILIDDYHAKKALQNA